MSIADLYASGEHRSNLAHFAALATIASVDGELNKEERDLLDRFATKLDITQSEYSEVLKKENKYPVAATHDSEKRLERLYDLFRIIYSDHEMDKEERMLVKRYAIGLGFSAEKAEIIINRSVQIFGGKLGLDDYLYLIRH